MSQLFSILYNSRNFFLFLFLQGLCFYLISKNNIYWNVAFFNSTNTFAAKSLELSQKGTEFVNLGKVNKELASENAALRKQLSDLKELDGNTFSGDSTRAFRFEYVVAKVVSSTHNLADNFITIDKGTKDGIKAGMGVISPEGIVGQVSYANEYYSRVYSILHSRQMVSAEVLNKKLRESKIAALGIAKWDGLDSRYIKLNTVDRFKPISKGDSVVTSAQNPIFPSNVLIGKVSEVSHSSAEAFHNIKVKLSTDFSSLMYVYVVKNKLIEKQEEVEINREVK